MKEHSWPTEVQREITAWYRREGGYLFDSTVVIPRKEWKLIKGDA
jgi:hypothetical protein